MLLLVKTDKKGNDVSSLITKDGKEFHKINTDANLMHGDGFRIGKDNYVIILTDIAPFRNYFVKVFELERVNDFKTLKLYK